MNKSPSSFFSFLIGVDGDDDCFLEADDSKSYSSSLLFLLSLFYDESLEEDDLESSYYRLPLLQRL